MTHGRTSPYYPQSNGKLERWHKSLKCECVRPKTPLTREDARRMVTAYVEHYKTVRLHSAIGYVTPADKLAGREPKMFEQRDQKAGRAPGTLAGARAPPVSPAVPSTSPMPQKTQLSDCPRPLGTGTDSPFHAEPVHRCSNVASLSPFFAHLGKQSFFDGVQRIGRRPVRRRAVCSCLRPVTVNVSPTH